MDKKEKLDRVVSERYEKWLDNAGKFTDEAGDIVNHVVLSLYDRGIDVDTINNIDNYINAAAKIAAWSKKSQYNRENERYVRAISIEDENIDIADEEPEEGPDVTSDDIFKQLDESPFSWCEKEIFLRKILEDKTLAEIGADFNLKIAQVYYTYNKIRSYLMEVNNVKKR